MHSVAVDFLEHHNASSRINRDAAEFAALDLRGQRRACRLTCIERDFAWSGRRESSPRMQLGKLADFEEFQ
jgi:hypothetical protein